MKGRGEEGQRRKHEGNRGGLSSFNGASCLFISLPEAVCVCVCRCIKAPLVHVVMSMELAAASACWSPLMSSNRRPADPRRGAVGFLASVARHFSPPTGGRIQARRLPEFCASEDACTDGDKAAHDVDTRFCFVLLTLPTSLAWI